MDIEKKNVPANEPAKIVEENVIDFNTIVDAISDFLKRVFPVVNKRTITKN